MADFVYELPPTHEVELLITVEEYVARLVVLDERYLGDADVGAVSEAVAAWTVRCRALLAQFTSYRDEQGCERVAVLPGGGMGLHRAFFMTDDEDGPVYAVSTFALPGCSEFLRS